MAQRPPSIGPTEPVAKTQQKGAVAPAEEIGRVDRTGAVKGVAATTAAEAAAPVKPVAQVAKTTATDRVHSIADRLRRGELTPDQAVEELIEDAVQQNLPGAKEGSALSSELRALLTAYAKDDPYLASRISRLGILR